MSNEIIKQKQFWDKESRNFDAIYSKNKSKLAIWLDSIFRWDMYERFEYTLREAQPIEGRTFLDVGCGTGRYSLELARRNAQKVVGIDVSSQMIETCKQRAMDENLQDRVLFFHKDLMQYQTDIAFDICIAMGLFDYVSDPLKMLIKIKECTNNVAIMSFPRAYTWRAMLRKVRLKLKKLDVYFYSREDVVKLLNQSGYKKFSINKIGQLYCVSAVI